MTLSRTEITHLLEKHGLSPRRAFGQNFVADANTVRRIARLANVGPGDLVIEIGAGLGSLTLALADTGADIIAVEIDHGLIRVLGEVVADLSNVTVIQGDAMSLDWNALIPENRTATMVANLPYNIATPLIADLLDTTPRMERFIVMVQKEVAQRLAAPPGTSEYGAVSVKVAYWATARLLGDVPPSVFIPRPKVTSSVIEIIRRPEPVGDQGVSADDLFAVVRKAFGQRRKMLRRSLSDMTTPDLFHRAQVSAEARPEELGVDQWIRLARQIMLERQTDIARPPDHSSPEINPATSALDLPPR